MRLPQVVLVGLCMLGTTHLALSQAQESAARSIPGFLNPATGKFSTKVARTSTPQPNAAAVTTSNVFFREDFQIYIANYDQKGTSAVCSVTLSSSGDSIGLYYEEEASVAATAVGSGFSCDVPVLTSWALQSPSTDTISANVSVTIYTPTTQASSIYLYPANYRSSTRDLQDLAQPANGATAVNSINFSL